MAFDAETRPVAVRRSMDAARINEIANDPTVRPSIGLGAIGPLDFTEALADPRNIAIEVTHGVFLFAQLEPGRYELHTLLLPEGRGGAVLPAASAAFRFMFVETDCLELVTKVPATNRPADLMARRAGFAPIFARSGAWEDGSDLTFFVMTLDAWRATDVTLAAEGHTFHEALEAAKRAAGSTLPAHPDDEAHDRAVGAACLMAKAGNPVKAAWTYNRWARFAGYQTVELLSANPPTFDVRDAVVAFRAGEMEILRCPPQP